MGGFSADVNEGDVPLLVSTVDPAFSRLDRWREAAQRTAASPDLAHALAEVAAQERIRGFPGPGVVAALIDTLRRAQDDSDRKAVVTDLQRWSDAALAPYDPVPKASDEATIAPPVFEVLHLVRPDLITGLAIGEDLAVVRVDDIALAEQALRGNPEIQAVVIEASRRTWRSDLAACRRWRPEATTTLVYRSGEAPTPSPETRVFHLPARTKRLIAHMKEGHERRSSAPWLTALSSRAARGVDGWHALPTADGRSFEATPRHRAYLELLGRTVLAAESSGTEGELDSLSTPKRGLKLAQERAATVFGGRPGADGMGTYFVTNGTSTANKIVAHAVLRPGDAVLIDRECHKSWHYALVLAGAHVRYVSGYPIPAHHKAGGVLRSELLAAVARVGAEGRRVAAVILTNCTFDGIVSDPSATMRAVIAAQPDDPPVFVWDEAWFATARFSPELRARTAMEAARSLHDEGVPVRVYATQSTHKTLSALRQGSMIHVFDDQRDEAAFHDAYLTHTSTSPSLLLLASLDVARRQVDLYGSYLVQRNERMAAYVRGELTALADRRPWHVLGEDDLLPPGCWTPEQGVQATPGEFVLDPTRVTISTAGTTLSGVELRARLESDHEIQVNLASPTTVLLNVHLGTRCPEVQSLSGALGEIFEQVDEVDAPKPERLPEPSPFAPAFQRDGGTADIRGAYYAARATATSTVDLADGTVDGGDDAFVPWPDGTEVDDGAPISSGFVTPYPPGYPVLVPGQVVTRSAYDFIRSQWRHRMTIHGLVDERALPLFAWTPGPSVRGAQEEG